MGEEVMNKMEEVEEEMQDRCYVCGVGDELEEVSGGRMMEMLFEYQEEEKGLETR